jgi:adenosylhomocysteine nucleosidase
MNKTIFLGALTGILLFAPIFGGMPILNFGKETIGIVIPVDYEFQAFNDIMDVESGRAKTLENITFYTHTVGDKKVVITKSQYGKVNAAIATTMLINDFDADYIICAGTAGGIVPDLKIGDILVSWKLLQYDVAEKTDTSYELMAIDINEDTAFIYFEADPHLKKVALQSAEKVDFLPIDGEEIDVREGTIGTADIFAGGAEYLDFVAQWNVDCAEMEGGAVAEVCYKFHKPFVVLRTMSDLVVESEEQYQKYAYAVSKNLALLVEEMIPAI